MIKKKKHLLAVSEALTWLAPRDNALVKETLEAPDGDDLVFGLEEGVFSHYRRTVKVTERDSQNLRFVESIEFKTDLPFFNWMFRPLLSIGLSKGPLTKRPWWAPPARFDRRSGISLSLLCALSLVASYVASLATQTTALAAEEFGATNSSQGALAFATRVGGLLAIAIGVMADHKGRKKMLITTCYAGIAVAVLGSMAPSFFLLGVDLTLARPLGTAVVLVIGVLAAEEVPAGARAYAVSLLAMAGALGAGFMLMALPLADTGQRGWRLVYLLALLWVPVVMYSAKRLPESKRFVASKTTAVMDRARLRLMAIAALLGNIFFAPASFYLNRYLLDERGYSAGKISAFSILTNTPGSIGIVIGGRMADSRGRRPVGAVGLALGATATVGFYFVSGSQMWLASVIGAIVGAAVIPALGVYGPELFPTGARGKSNGIIMGAGLVGSGIGLLGVGYLSDRWGTFSTPMLLAAAGPVALSLVVLKFFPETANLELEQINPQDTFEAEDGPS